MRNMFSFANWLFKRLFSKVRKVYRRYDDMVVDSPGISALPTFFFAILFSVFATFGLVINNMFFPTGFWFILTGLAVIFGNYFRIILRELYKDFKRERQALFEMLKD